MALIRNIQVTGLAHHKCGGRLIDGSDAKYSKGIKMSVIIRVHPDVCRNLTIVRRLANRALPTGWFFTRILEMCSVVENKMKTNLID